jgi:DNA repair exonuclease SbcCD ATPase subunit
MEQDVNTVESVKDEQEIGQSVEEVNEGVEQEAKPVEKIEETKDTEIKTFTQDELDEIVKKRLSRQQASFEKERESILAEKENEWQEKLKSIESDTQNMASELQQTKSELTRRQYGIKEEKYDEVLALKEFKMNKNPELSEEDALKGILEEHSDYVENTIKNIGIEIKNDTKETPLYSEEMLRMYPFLKKI